MTTLVTIAFLLAVTGCFLILRLSPFSFLEGLAAFIKPEKQSLKSRIEQNRKSRQPRGLKLLFLETKEVLRVTGKSGMFSVLCVLSMFLFVVGVLMALTMKNTYMVPVLAAGLALLPFYYVKFTAGRHKRQVGTELETALSIITTSYLRGNNYPGHRGKPALLKPTGSGGVPQFSSAGQAYQLQFEGGIGADETGN